MSAAQRVAVVCAGAPVHAIAKVAALAGYSVTVAGIPPAKPPE